jgi:hypothetical protein
MAAPDHIADYLVAQSQRTAVGTDVFVHSLPDSPDDAWMVAQFAIGAPIRTMPAGSAGRAAEQLGIQIQCRHTSRAAAETAAYTVFNLFDGFLAQTLSGTLYLGLLARKSPAQLKIDQVGRFIWYTEFSCLRKP